MTATLDDLRREIAAALRDAFDGDDRAATAGLDARLIVAEAAGVAPERMIAAGDRTVADVARARAMALAERRAAGEPVARLTGRKEFYGLTLELGPDALVPRPDTETLVDAALAAAEAGGFRDARATVLDLGTGSGAVLLALLANMPKATGLGIDIAPGAVATARRNAHINGLEGRARFAVGDWAEAVAGTFDLVVANPPYIATGELASLPVEVRRHDPALALDGGADGLAAFRRIVPDLDRLLSGRGAAAVEIGPTQADAVASLGTGEGYDESHHRDLAGRPRAIAFRRRKTTEPA